VAEQVGRTKVDGKEKKGKWGKRELKNPNGKRAADAEAEAEAGAEQGRAIRKMLSTN